MSELVEVRVSEKEWQYLRNGSVLSLDLQQRMVSLAEPLPHGAYLLRIPHQYIEEFRGAFTDSLARTGFDEVYALNHDGRMLEDLLDRFFIP